MRIEKRFAFLFSTTLFSTTLFSTTLFSTTLFSNADGFKRLYAEIAGSYKQSAYQA